jgi:hypothetical protein
VPAGSRNDPDDATVADRGSAWMAMQPSWQLIETVLGGTAAMRSAGPMYLPQYPEEDNENYSHRLNRSVLTNYLKKSLRSLAAKPFMKPMTIKNMAPGLEHLLVDADREGNSLHVFSHRNFRAGMSKGLSHILVDFPRVSSPDGTMAGQRSSRAAPYLRQVAAENVIAGYADVIDGEEQYTHVRILMQSVRRIGSFGERMVNEILVMEPGVNQIWLLVDQDKDEWVMTDEWNTSLDFVPLVTFYADRIGFLEADPPLIDVANLNVAHWQSESDQTNVLTVTRFPILGASGVTSISQSDQPTPSTHRIGPHQVLTASDPQSRFYYVEHTGAAIAAGAAHGAHLEDAMAELAMDLVLRGRSGRITATAHSIDKAEADTALSQMAVDYEEAINQALRYANAWQGNDSKLRFKSAGECQLASDFGLSLRDSQEVRDLMEARANGWITHESLLRELKRRSVLNDDFDIVLELAALAKETPVDEGEDGGSPSPSSPTEPTNNTLRAVQ